MSSEAFGYRNRVKALTGKVEDGLHGGTRRDYSHSVWGIHSEGRGQS